MDFDLSADQVALQEAAADLLGGFASVSQVRAVVEAGGGLDDTLWKAMVDQGWTGIAVPEHRGGIGLGWVEAAVLLEQLGRHVAPAPFLQQVVALDALVAAAESGVAEAAVPLAGLLDGTIVSTVAWSPVHAVEEGGHWRLSGRTEPAVYAPSAEVAVVRARMDPGGGGGEGNPEDDGLFLVDLDADGRPAAQPAMDLTRQVGWLSFDGHRAVRLGGTAAVDRFLDTGSMAMSAELLGVAGRSMELAVDYAKQRQQFGQPIGSFQAVKHRCADMLVDVEGMRSAVWWAAWCAEVDDRDRSVAASTAKSWCSDASRRVTASALQVHGGIGFTWECDVHLFLKRAQLDQVSFGDATFHRARLGDLLRRRVAAGESVI